MAPEARAKLVVANLNDTEKSGILVNGAAGIPRINWPAYQWWSEALHGVARDGVATSFPQICGVGASYNRTLFHAIGDVTSTEGRGKNNDVQGNMYKGLTFWAPNVNIFRDPRWGRGQETPGEDPTLNGEYATEFVQGMQSNQSSGFLKVSACLKHYAAYSEEQGRNSFAAVVTAQDMEDTYLPAFEAGITKGNASGLMCSYNAETYGNGLFGKGSAAQHGAIPSCANKGLLNDLIRDKWGFDGYVTSDCGAVGNVQNQHNYTSNPKDTITAVLGAGMDTDCGGFMGSKAMMSVIDDPKISGFVDDALVHLFSVQFRLGFGDPDSIVPFATLGSEVVNTPAHQQLAKEAADQSIVLLKNAKSAGSLPWKAASLKQVAVIGRNANASNNMQGNYYGTAPYLVTPDEGIAKYVKTSYANGSDVDAAVALVADADAIVLVVGLTSEGQRPGDETEGHDRSQLTLPDKQDDLIAAVAAAAAKANKPVSLVSMNGGPLDLSAVKANAAIASIMWCGYPGQSGGDAIADAIFGKTNPSGKLSVTWYPQSFADTVSILDMGMRPNPKTGNPGRSYRFYTGTPVFKFGEGMSYTTFATDLAVSQSPTASVATVAAESTMIRAKTSVVATIEASVTNTGDRQGAETVLIFAKGPTAGVDGAPLKSLIAFEKVQLAASDKTSVSFDIQSHHFTHADVEGKRVATKGTWKIWAGLDNEDSAVEVELV